MNETLDRTKNISGRKILNLVIGGISFYNRFNTFYGFENFPREGGVLMLMNHAGIFDFGAVFAKVKQIRSGEEPVVVAKNTYGEDTEFGEMLKSGGAILINRDEIDFSATKKILTALYAGKVVIIAIGMTYDLKVDLFPNESDKRMQVFNYARKTNVPYVNCSLTMSSFSYIVRATSPRNVLKDENNQQLYDRFIDEVSLVERANNARRLFLHRFRDKAHALLERDIAQLSTEELQKVAFEALKKLGTDEYDIGKHILRGLFRFVKEKKLSLLLAILSKIKLLTITR
jgi:1-acyl-sn-glycerol-3-phosphate acyltransferase